MWMNELKWNMHRKPYTKICVVYGNVHVVGARAVAHYRKKSCICGVLRKKAINIIIKNEHKQSISSQQCFVWFDK